MSAPSTTRSDDETDGNGGRTDSGGNGGRTDSGGSGGRTDSGGENLLDAIDDVRSQYGSVTVSCQYECHSGETFGGRWRGVAVADLLTSADPETTHVRAVSTDGYCVPVPVAVALETVVATERLEGSTESNEDDDSLPRLVGDEISGSWTVRDVARLEAVSLPADGDAEPCYVDDPADAPEDSTRAAAEDRSEVVG